MALNYYQQGLDAAQEVRDREKESSYLNCLGWVYRSLGQPQQAIEVLQQSKNIDNCQNISETLRMLGDAYNDLHYHKEAIQAYQSALELNPDDIYSHNNLAGVYVVIGQLGEATLHYQRRIELRPEVALNARVSLGVIARHQGNDDEARIHFEKALEDMLDNAQESDLYTPFDFLECKAIALLCTEQMEEALDTLQKALDQRQPKDTIDFTLYNFLAAAPNPPRGLDKMRQLLTRLCLRPTRCMVEVVVSNRAAPVGGNKEGRV